MAESSARPEAKGQIRQASASRALLTSLHPSGDPDSILSIDAQADRAAAARSGDVVVLAMTAAQCRDRRRCEPMLEYALEALASNGILWVEVPRRSRPSIAAALRKSGMAIGAPTICRRRGAASTEFPLTPAGLRFALTGGHISRRWRLPLAFLERAPWAQSILFRLLPRVGFAALRPGTRPFGWLADSRSTMDRVDVALTTNWRGEGAPFLIFAIGADETIIAKRGSGHSRAQVENEAAMLKLVGAGVAGAGLEVPRLIEHQKTKRLSTLIETAVPGRPMASWIREGRHRDFAAVVQRLAEWLGVWNGRTVRNVELTPELSERLILSPARGLADTIEGGGAYLDWLCRQARRLIGHQVPLVAAHNDLTMANVLADRRGLRSVVDWEAAAVDGLPLADFHYASCDAAAAISDGDRLAAFRACFLADGEFRRRVEEAEAHLRAIVAGPPEWLELCFHGCWLRHAANEQARASSNPDRAFLAIAELLGGTPNAPVTTLRPLHAL